MQALATVLSPRLSFSSHGRLMITFDEVVDAPGTAGGAPSSSPVTLTPALGVSGADDVANAALFLLSQQASGVFGTTSVVDGGLTAGFDFRTGAEGASI